MVMTRSRMIELGMLRVCKCGEEFMTRQEARKHGFEAHGSKFAAVQNTKGRMEARGQKDLSAK